VDHRTLEHLRKTNSAWKLMQADHAPMVLSFLYKTFIQPNVRTLSEPEAVSKLADHLAVLREAAGEEAYPNRAEYYLDDWASDKKGWMRKYYPPGSDEAHYDLTPAAEQAIDWVTSLERPQFVTAESRLITVFELLRQIAEGTDTNPKTRVAELKRKQAELEARIQQIQRGELPLLDDTQVKDRFLEMAATARGLLGDFRQVEQNFRTLDRAVRERVATWEGSKGSLLEEIFSQRDAIASSDQGRSFRAFWDFLMSPARQEELTSLLEMVFGLKPVKDLAPDRRLRRVHYDWLEAGEVAQRTVARLSEQLRRYLDDQAWLENRRIMQLIRGVEQNALAVRSAPPSGVVMELDEPAPEIELPMERPLYTPPFKARVEQQQVEYGDQSVAAEALFEQVYVDKTELLARIRQALQTRSQVSLADLVAQWELEKGLAELVTYLSLASEDDAAIIDDRQKQTLRWRDAEGIERQATMPLVIFTRKARAKIA
jgi:flagellar motility protein MotE (MotC chaperone)